ncbi:hypothetical protein PAL_GLEAN10015256 [Pteropus alecto]|uniref:Uncharacterized protein n=1 Tax=Pteropus alecto TaxID=9402 RepID=L5KEC4_PTEAL|nr:hypothetical protein PAL_GLEAN10015256 [Pteropus alecto]
MPRSFLPFRSDEVVLDELQAEFSGLTGNVVGSLLGRCLFLESRPRHSHSEPLMALPRAEGVVKRSLSDKPVGEKGATCPGRPHQSLVLATSPWWEPQPRGHRLGRDPPCTTRAAAPLGTHQLPDPRRPLNSTPVSAHPGVTDPDISSPRPAHRGRSQRGSGTWRETQLRSATGRPRCHSSFIRWTRLCGRRLHTGHCARHRLLEDETSRCIFPIKNTSRTEGRACDDWQRPHVRAAKVQDQVQGTRKLQRKDRAGPKHRFMHRGNHTGTRMPKAPGGCLFPREKASGLFRLQVQKERDPPQAWPGAEQHSGTTSPSADTGTLKS